MSPGPEFAHPSSRRVTCRTYGSLLEDLVTPCSPRRYLMSLRTCSPSWSRAKCDKSIVWVLVFWTLGTHGSEGPWLVSQLGFLTAGPLVRQAGPWMDRTGVCLQQAFKNRVIFTKRCLPTSSSPCSHINCSNMVTVVYWGGELLHVFCRGDITLKFPLVGVNLQKVLQMKEGKAGGCVSWDL